MPYLDAGGVHTYYEEHGDAGAEPVLLLHGGLSSSDDWGAQTPALADHYRVILPDRRGHGRTPRPHLRFIVPVAGICPVNRALNRGGEPFEAPRHGLSD